MGKSSEPLLAYEHVDISYAGVAAVRDVSFELAPGEILGLVGASGSGKSTLVKAAMGLLGEGNAVTAGSIRYKGRDVSGLSAEELRHMRGPEMAMVFQDSLAALCPVRTIGAQVWEAARAHGASRGRASKRETLRTVSSIFERIGLEDSERIMSSRPYELSGGMGQRVGIAMALAMDPSVILADEPTSALDVTTQAQVIDELRRAHDERGCSMIVVTHSMGVARALCDRIVVLHEGRVVETGKTADVLENPHDAYTRELIAAAPRIVGGER